jgi:hypothetical protein
MAINASAVEEWFADNPFISSDGQDYTFDVLNFTDFDSPDHSIEHWYTITQYDLEANSIRDFWRLEWDNPLNPNVRFPFPGFSSRHRLFYLDPSAFQWYLAWARIWWELSVSGPKYQYYYQDLDEFLATHNVTANEGKLALAHYLAGWIDDILSNDFSVPYFLYPDGPPLINSLSLQILILNNASQYGYTNERMAWILNTSLVETNVLDLLPYLDLEVSVRFENLTEFPEINSILSNSTISSEDGWTYIDGFELFFDLYWVREAYFNLTAAELVVNCYVFLLKNASMISAGMEFTGLGGGGQQLILMSIDRYFRQDGVTPKGGLGLIMIHELGHNLGLPHTFQADKFAGDFICDVMGYYPYSYSFSKLRTDVMRRTIVDKKLLDLLDRLVEDEYLYNQSEPSTILDWLFEEIHEKIDQMHQQYDRMSYLDAYYTVVETEKLEEQLRTQLPLNLSLDVLEDKIEELKETIENLNKTVDYLYDLCQSLNQTYLETLNELNQALNERDTLQDDYQELQNDYNSLNSTYNTTLGNLQRLQDEKEQLQVEVAINVTQFQVTLGASISVICILVVTLYLTRKSAKQNLRIQ